MNYQILQHYCSHKRFLQSNGCNVATSFSNLFIFRDLQYAKVRNKLHKTPIIR